MVQIEHSQQNTHAQHSISPLDEANAQWKPGERFHMDMGFVRGKKYSTKDEDERIITIITSLDGYKSYLLIIDWSTRYEWVFLYRTKHHALTSL